MFSAIRTVSRFTGDPDSIVDGEITQGGFNCYDDSINVGIQAGDILGACIFDSHDISFIITRLPLDIVGEVSGGSLLQMSTAECSRQDIPSNIPDPCYTADLARSHVLTVCTKGGVASATSHSNSVQQNSCKDIYIK